MVLLEYGRDYFRLGVMLEFQGVSKQYGDDRYVLRDINLSFPKGAFVALNGPSGSGKTTLLNLSAGLDDPTEGRVWAFGQDLSGLNKRARSLLRLNKMGFVFQAYNLLPVLTACENVELTCLLQGLPAEEARQRALTALTKVGLQDFAGRRPALLSGGQQQRVAVARAIAGSPEVIFADEPTANLDSANAFQLIQLFQSLNRESGVAFIFSTHDQRLSEAVNFCVNLEDGRVVTKETPGDKTKR